jgi:hypothetical protein
MAPKKAKQLPRPVITLGVPELDELAPSSPPDSTQNHESTPLPDDNSNPSEAEEATQKRALGIRWSAEMEEALVEYLYKVWLDGRASDNGFKKEIFMETAMAVNRVAGGILEVNWDKCKNKWGYYKEKWKHWMILSQMSGFGWSEEREKYKAYEYVWNNLNKAYPRIIWHKTHVLEHRDILSKVLHESQATGKGAVSGTSSDTAILIDPRLLDNSATLSASASPAPQAPHPKPKILYNRSKKRVKIKGSDDKGEGVIGPVAKKVDLGYVISSLSAEMARGRKAREEHKSAQEKAVQLLESYRDRLDTMAFIKGCAFFENEAKARIFIGITIAERRDRWLEVNLHTELRPVGLS